MFTLKIHTVEFPEALQTTVLSAPSSSSTTANDLKPVELKGVAHLFRQLPTTAATAALSTVANIATRTKLIFIVAVPNYLSTDDFLLFCGNQLPHFQEILFLR